MDLAYKKDNNSKIAVEILLGHGNCHIIIESNVSFNEDEINPIVERIAGKLKLDLHPGAWDDPYDGAYYGITVTPEARNAWALLEQYRAAAENQE